MKKPLLFATPYTFEFRRLLSYFYFIFFFFFIFLLYFHFTSLIRIFFCIILKNVKIPKKIKLNFSSHLFFVAKHLHIFIYIFWNYINEELFNHETTTTTMESK